MEKEKRTSLFSTTVAIFVWGGLWGIFEGTVGYLIHFLPISVGWLIWYPAACFFMLNVYRKTRRAEAVLLVGLLSACIKLLNLFLPGPIDRVLNPAVSIVFEALALTVLLLVYNSLVINKKSRAVKGMLILCMNTGWRTLYILYLLLLVPDWMREISVISSSRAFLMFFLIHNLVTSMVLFGGALGVKAILRPVYAFERRLSGLFSPLTRKAASSLKATGAVLLLAFSIAIEMWI